MSTNNSWKIVYKTDLSYRAEIIKQILDKNKIPNEVKPSNVDEEPVKKSLIKILVNELDYVEAKKIIQRINFD